MKNMRKLGFTLIELLAVILILGIIALIAIPTISNIINEAKKNSLKASSNNYVESLENEISVKLLKGEEVIDGIYNISSFNVEVKGTKPLENSCILLENGTVKKYVMHYKEYTVKSENEIITIDSYNEGITCTGTYIYNAVNTFQTWGYNDATKYNAEQYRKKIKTVTFNLSDDIPVDALISWDVSENQDNSVVAYIMLRNDEYYNLYIGSNGGVLANENSANIFYNFTILETMNFQYFDISNTENMSNMFANCYVLESENLNYENWNVSNVTNMSNLFKDCRSFTEIDLSKWDTSKVTNMSGMFMGCNNVKTYNLSDFNTSNVTDMSNMFSWNSSLKI